MKNIDNLINERREEIITEAEIGKIIGSIFKGIAGIIFGPYILILAFLIVISPFIFISNLASNKRRKVDEDKLRNAIRRNPEFIKNLNKIAQNIYNTFVKSIGNSNYFTFLPISNAGDVYVTNDSYIGSEFIRFNVSTIFKSVTGCNDYQEYERKMNHDDPDTEPYCKELEELLKKIEYTIDSINEELSSKYKGVKIQLSESIDYEYPISSIEYFESSENSLTINIYIKAISSIDSIEDENTKNELKKTIITMKPIIEKRIK